MKWSIFTLISIVFTLFLAVYLLNYHPAEIEEMKVITRTNNAHRTLKIGMPVKVMNWNVQYMAGKGYVFFYDLLDESGPDKRPSRESISRTIDGVARIISAENPDIILLQEVDDGSKRSDYEDQLARLLALISPEYISHSSAFYHKSRFVPHPKIMGAVGMKLSTISKFPIKSARRHQLPLKPDNWLKRQFDLKRAVLETRFAVKDSADLIVLNTHLSAFSQGTDTLKKQIESISSLIKSYEAGHHQWIIGGDFNLLANKEAYHALGSYERQYYNPSGELELLTKRYPSVPPTNPAESSDPKWFTHYPNNPAVKKPDRIIDYIFFPKEMTIISGYIRQSDTISLSDHFPVIVKIQL